MKNNYKPLRKEVEIMIKKLEKVLQEYSKKIDEIQQSYQTKKAYIGQNFKGEYYQSSLSIAKAEREQEINAIKEATKGNVNRIIDELKEKVDNMVISDAEKLATLQGYRGIKLSATEIEALAKANQGDYMAMKLLSQLASDNGYNLRYTSVEDLQEAITELESKANTFLKSYDGTKESQSYTNGLITVLEHPFEDYEELFNSSSLSVTTKPRPSLTQEQAEVIKGLFEGCSDIEARAEALNFAGMDGKELLSSYYEIISAEA